MLFSNASARSSCRSAGPPSFERAPRQPSEGVNKIKHSAALAAAKRRTQHGGQGGFTETAEKRTGPPAAWLPACSAKVLAGAGSTEADPFCTLFLFSVASAGLRELCTTNPELLRGARRFSCSSLATRHFVQFGCGPSRAGLSSSFLAPCKENSGFVDHSRVKNRPTTTHPESLAGSTRTCLFSGAPARS